MGRKKHRKKIAGLVILLILLIGLIGTCAFVLGKWFLDNNQKQISSADGNSTEESVWSDQESAESSPVESSMEVSQESSQESSMEESTPEESQAEESYPELKARCVESTDPDLYLTNQKVYVNGEVVEDYKPSKVIRMDDHQYAQADGIFTFRGNNFRTGAVVGEVTAEEEKFGMDDAWYYTTGYFLTDDGGIWSGNGWTGQPLLREWTRQEKQNMNMYDWAK